MTLRTTLAALACCMALPTAALAQATGEAGAPTDPSTPPGGELSVGEAAGSSEAQIYIRETHGDWEIRCIRAPEGQVDPCQMFQRLSDQAGNPTVDVNLFLLPDSGEVVAGATVITPLETLLTAPLTMAVDGGEARRYPYAFCDPAGCYVRIGLRQAEIDQLRRGAVARLTVVPALAPDRQVVVEMSLTGFTAGLAALTP
jgi:invasion protein IalB